MHVAVAPGWRMGVVAAKLTLADFLPRALGMLLGATHAGCEVLEAVHVQSAAPVAWRQNALALSQSLHAMYHLGLERSAVIFLLWLAVPLIGRRQEVSRRVRDWDGGVHHRMELRLVQVRGSGHIVG
jgi:hypothetical protein